MKSVDSWASSPFLFLADHKACTSPWQFLTFMDMFQDMLLPGWQVIFVSITPPTPGPHLAHLPTWDVAASLLDFHMESLSCCYFIIKLLQLWEGIPWNYVREHLPHPKVLNLLYYPWGCRPVLGLPLCRPMSCHASTFLMLWEELSKAF